MRSLKFKKIDAFTKGTSSGNPAGYVLLDGEGSLTEEEMQRIARELKGYVNEVGYVRRAGEAFQLKFYSSECEVAFCGHATIAIMYDLLSTDRSLGGQSEVSIEIGGQTLSVFNYIEEEDAVYIMAPDPEFLACDLSAPEVAGILGAGVSDMDEALPIGLVNGGLRTLLVPLKSLSCCLGLLPDEEDLRAFCVANGIDIVLVFTAETHCPGNRYRTRVFGPRFGYLEDPATGSGNAALGYYLIDRNLWDGDITVEQGPDRDTPNLIKLKRYERNGKVNMIFGGCGTTRVDGRYLLHGLG